MNTPMPAKTNTPPRTPSTRTSAVRPRLSGAPPAGDAIAAAISPADSPCVRARATMSSRARVRALTSDMSVRLLVVQPAHRVRRGEIVALKLRGQDDRNHAPLLHQGGGCVVAM